MMSLSNGSGLRAVLLLLACFGAGFAQTNPPAGQVSQVTISAPLGTAQQPFRTSFSQLAVAFSHNGGGTGLFVATSQGADVGGTNFLINESAGTVGAYFNTSGLKTVSVKVSTTQTASQAVSPPTFIVFDNTPPIVNLTQIRVDPRLPFEPFVPGKTYFTSADAIVLKGIVNDGPTGTAAQEIALQAQATGGSAGVATVDSAGQFEVSVPLAGVPEGPGEIRIEASDKMSDGSRPNVGKGQSVRLGE